MGSLVMSTPQDPTTFQRGYQPIYPSFYGPPHDARYSAIWVYEPLGPDLQMIHDVPEPAFNSWFQEQRRKRYIVTHVTATGTTEGAIFAGDMEEDRKPNKMVWTLDNGIKNWEPSYGTPNNRKYCIMRHENRGYENAALHADLKEEDFQHIFTMKETEFLRKHKSPDSIMEKFMKTNGRTEDDREAVVTNDIFPLARVNKMFTTAAIEHLINRGKLPTQTKVYKQMGYFDAKDERAMNITVKYLLEHKGGHGQHEPGEDISVDFSKVTLSLPQRVAKQPLLAMSLPSASTIAKFAGLHELRVEKNGYRQGNFEGTRTHAKSNGDFDFAVVFNTRDFAFDQEFEDLTENQIRPLPDDLMPWFPRSRNKKWVY
ncbi:penicillin-binding protein [Fusarium napiforme]|uniref:Penicillin-binding protein n=1 Tax=Fusarium napiforme TaxID=42672 RepID=A0A8H5N1Y9_9HYPO|nr:penicillin-binding protein [Fusarium napiforme]